MSGWPVLAFRNVAHFVEQSSRLLSPELSKIRRYLSILALDESRIVLCDVAKHPRSNIR